MFAIVIWSTMALPKIARQLKSAELSFAAVLGVKVISALRVGLLFLVQSVCYSILINLIDSKSFQISGMERKLQLTSAKTRPIV